MNMSLAENGIRESATVDVDGEEAIGCLQALQLTSLYVLPSMLNAAVELDVFGIIARRASSGGGVSADEVALEIPKARKPGFTGRLDRLLCLLASHSLLKSSVRAIGGGGGEGGFERTYGLTPTGKFFLRNDQGRSLASMLPLVSHRVILQLLSYTTDAILEGESQFEKANGMSVFEYMSIDPTFNNTYNQCMTGLSSVVMDEVLNIYSGFEGLSSLVDVGGGEGTCINMVISKYPSIKAINFDQPHVVRVAPSYPGVEHVGGDMFVSVPEGEAIMIKEILHDWDDECCIKLLKKCHEALPEKGKVIVINMLMPEAPDSSLSSKYITQMDSAMLMAFQSHERTAKQFEALCKGSGFSEFWVADKLAHSIWAVMEFRK